MKKALLLLIVVIGHTFSEAQQRPQYTQYVFSPILINPAVTGIERYIDARIGYRSQWVGIEGAPVTSFLSLSIPIGNDFVSADGVSHVSPYSVDYTDRYRASDSHHGLGFTLVSDQAGPFSTTNINANYAYHLTINDQLNLAVGASLGLEDRNLNASQLQLTDPDDLTINSAGGNHWRPALGQGVWLYSSTYFGGLSSQQVLIRVKNKTSFNGSGQEVSAVNWFLTSGFKLFLSDDITLLPSALVKIIRPLPTAFDVNLKLAFRESFWVGCSYRNQDAVAGLVGLNINSLINIGYSYDYTTSALRSVSTGSHEIVLALLLNNKNKVICPEHTF